MFDAAIPLPLWRRKAQLNRGPEFLFLSLKFGYTGEVTDRAFQDARCIMSESVNLLMLEFLSWVSSRRRTYNEAMEAWQSHCPRQTIWEDAMIDGYIELNRQGTVSDPEVTLTPLGRAHLNGNNGHS
jgi:hypothetical protein